MPSPTSYILADVFAVQAGELAQDLFRSFIRNSWNNDSNFYQLVSPCAGTKQRGSTFFSHSKDLAVLCSRRNPNHRTAINGGNFNFCSQRRLCETNRQYAMN